MKHTYVHRPVFNPMLGVYLKSFDEINRRSDKGHSSNLRSYVLNTRMFFFYCSFIKSLINDVINVAIQRKNKRKESYMRSNWKIFKSFLMAFFLLTRMMLEWNWRNLVLKGIPRIVPIIVPNSSFTFESSTISNSLCIIVYWTS